MLFFILCNRQFLYDLYKRDGLPLIHDVTKLRKWIQLISKEIGVNLNPTVAIIKKVYKITNAIVNRAKKLRKQGGRQMKLYLQKDWQIQLSPNDVKNPRQIALETKLKKTTEEKSKLEKKNKTLLKQKANLRQQVTHLAARIQKAKSSGFKSTRGKSKNKTQYSQRWLREMKKQRHTKCSSSLAWLESEGYTALKVTVKNNATDDTEIINMDTDELLGPQGSSATEDEVDLLNMILYVKDKYNLSGAAYHEMAQLFKSMPRHHKLKDRIAQLNTLWNIHPMPDGVVGVQQSFGERLQICLQHLV